MFQDDNRNCEMVVIVSERPEHVVAFIEDKINKHAYDLEDFKVIQGTRVSLRAERAQVKVLLTN
jgi:hypothetical protein